MTSQSDAAQVRFPPPLVPLIAAGMGEVLHRVAYPLELPFPGAARAITAGLLLAAGVALIAAAHRLFHRTAQDPRPWKPSPELIEGGIYRFTRNPMYLGLLLMQAGLGVALADGWVVAFLPLSALALYAIAIRHEETYLEARFGSAYRDYQRRVRRWF